MQSKKDFDSLPDEQKLTMSRIMVASASEKVAKLTDELSSAGLKRVLKLVSHVHIADAILGREQKFDISEKEQVLIDTIFNLQETVFGHQTLKEELERNADPVQEEGIETVNNEIDLTQEDINE
jgi:hypothetical protein